MKRKWSEDNIKEYVENEGYVFIELLIDKALNSRIMVWCGNPNHKPYDVKFNNFKNGRRCPKCANENKGKYRKFTFEYVKEYIESFGYKLLSKEYVNNSEYLILQCPEGHIYNTATFSTFKDRGCRCPHCHGNMKHTLKEIEEYVKLFGYELLSEEYKNDKSKILLKCPNPNHKSYETRFSCFKYQNTRCPYCYKEQRSEKQKLSYEYICKEIEKENYKLLSLEYEDAKSEIRIECEKGHKYKTKWNKFQQGHRCPYCNISKGERRISDYLNSKNLEYKSQYKFKDCKLKQQLPFDFYLPEYNILIEYDGIQHFQIVEHFGGFDGFIDRIIRDTVKNEYCKKNNIKLIRIPYWDFDNIEEILNKELELK